MISVVNNVSQKPLDPIAAHQDPLLLKVTEAVQGKISLNEVEIQQLQSDQLQRLLPRIVENETAIDRLAEMIPLSKLEEWVRLDCPAHVNVWELAKDMINEAKLYLEKKDAPKISFDSQLRDVVGSILQGFEAVIQAFGITEFFRPVENKSEAKLKTQIITTLLQLFTLLSTIALPVLGAGTSGLVIGCTLISISLLSIAYPYIAPRPRVIPKTENWSRQIQLNQFAFPEGRKMQLKEIADSLVAAKNTKRGYPLLIGKSGVGKTDTAKAFAAAVGRGEFPELKGKSVFYINTADFAAGTDTHKYLNQLSETLGRHRDEIILIWDEIHMACRAGSGQILSEQMKTMLGQEFPYVIGITTNKEFVQEMYGKNPPFVDRFKQIAIGNTDEIETLQILTHTLLKDASSVLVSPNALSYLIEQSKELFGKEAVQPAASLRLLSLCLKQTGRVQKTDLEKQIEQLRAKIDALQAELVLGAEFPFKKRKEIRQLFDRLKFLQTQMQAQTRSFERLFANRNRYLRLKSQMYREVLEVHKDPNSPETNHFLLTQHYVLPALEEKIRLQASRLGIHAILDKELIDEVVAAEKNAMKKASLLSQNGIGQTS